MGRARFTPEQIIGKLREAELILGQGMNIREAAGRSLPLGSPGAEG